MECCLVEYEALIIKILDVVLLRGFQYIPRLTICKEVYSVEPIAFSPISSTW
jgi:hypothetical protein